MRQIQVAEATQRAHGGAVQIEEKCIEWMAGYPALFMRKVLDENFIPPLVARIQQKEHIKTEQILQKCIGDVSPDAKEIDLEVFARWSHTDYALELRGGRLWLFSVSVREVRN